MNMSKDLGVKRASARSFAVTGALVLVMALTACGSPQERAAEYMKRAQAFYDQGDYVKAKLEAQNAAQIAPKDAAAHYLLALVAEQQQEFRPMVQHLLMAVDADPKLVPARVKLGSLYFFGQAFDQATEQAKAATELAPDDPDVHVLNARLLLQKQEVEAGTKELDAALAKNPDLVDAILLRAAVMATSDPVAGLKVLDDAIARLGKEKAKPLRQVRIAFLAQQNRTSEMEQSFRELIRDYPKEEEFQYALARFYASQGRVDDAERVMRSVVALDPNDLEARLGLAQFLAQMRSPEAAEKALEAFVAENPNQLELRSALGRLYEANKKPDAALAVYEELAKRDPKSRPGLFARVRVGALKIVKGDVSGGTKLIDAVLVDEPDNADALLIRAGLRVQNKQFNDAIADVRTVLRKEPNNVRAMLLLARTHTLMNDRVLAKDAYRRMLAADPKNADAPRELAALEAMDKNFDAAEDVLRARLKEAPADIDTASRLIDLLGSQQAWREAEVEARRVSALPDDKGVGQFQLGRLALSQKKNAEAVEAFRKALEKNPEAVLALEGLATTLETMGRKEEAAAVLQDYLKKNPGNLSAKFLQGSTLARTGDVASAEKVFSEIVGAKPDASLAWAALARLNPNDPEKRIDAYKRGLAANPGNAELGLLLGTELEQAKRYDEAIAHYQELLKANPNVDIATNNLASLLLDYRSDPASHARALELAKKLDTSSNAAFLDTVGWAYYRNKDYPQAVQFCERAVAAAGQVPLLRYHLGMAYLANKNPAGARQELQQAVTTTKADFPGLEEAKATLQRLSSGTG
jgi:tetratricopeptide (TPR) repeat protein